MRHEYYNYIQEVNRNNVFYQNWLKTKNWEIIKWY